MKISKPVFLLLLAASFFVSCRKNSVEEQFTETISPVLPDFSTQVSASVAGFVTDENGNAIESATVQAGSITASTDAYGYFRIDNVAFAKTAGFVHVSSPGYFRGTKTFIPVSGKQTFVRLQLASASATGTIASVSGGTVTSSGGASVTLPANAVVVASNNAAYSGNINIAMHWLDPSDEQTTQLIMPGDLRAVDSAGYLKTLTTFGMLAVELSGDAGELLQLAPGVKAALHFPIPSSLQSVAPATIPLWYFNEQTGLWKEEGYAIKNGSSYDGEVAHFSWWNADVPNSIVNFTAQLVSSQLKPLGNVPVSISIKDVPNSTLVVYSDSAGHVNGMMPANNNVVVKISSLCNASVFSSNISTSTSNVDMGTLTVDAQQYSASFTGIVNKCNGQPVTNGYVIVAAGGLNQLIEINNGIFYRQSIICPGTSATIVAFDRDASQLSLGQNSTLITGLNDFGTIAACGTSNAETITYSIDGGPATTLAIPFYIFTGGFDFANNITGISAFDQINSINAFSFNCSGLDVPGNHPFIGNVLINQQVYIPDGSIPVITEYGLIGQFINGSCSGLFDDSMGNSHQISFTFSVKRDS